MNFRHHWIFGLLFFLVFDSDGQNTSTAQILSASLKDNVITILDQSNDRIQLMDYNLPFLEKIEFRTESNRLIADRQEFMLRTSFNNFGEGQAERNKFKAMINKKYAKTALVKNEILSERYDDVMNLIFSNLKKSDLSDYKTHLLDKLKILETMLSNGLSIDLDDYISIKEEIVINDLKVNNLEADYKSICEKINFNIPNELDLTYLPTPIQAKEIISGLNPNFDDHPNIKNYDYDTQLLNANLNVLRTENAKILDFVQAKYTLREDLLLENRFSLGLGINIPWNGSYTLKKQDVKIKLDEVYTEKEIMRSKLKSDFEQSLFLFQQEYEKYQLWQNLKRDTTISMLKDKVIKSGRLDPLKVLVLNETEMKATSKALEHYEALLKLYIKIIKVSGQLFVTPYRDYLNYLRPELVE
jgi:hypothetical protein